jgi:hypothetical protein
MLHKLLHHKNIKLWEHLTGGANSCYFVKDLKTKNPQIYTTVMEELRYYTDAVQDMYSELAHVRGGEIMSAPNALAQFEGHRERPHSDYTANVLEQPSNERPVSIIITVDPFRFMYLPRQNMTKNDIQKIRANPREMIMFTNTCLHSGDVNNSNNFACNYLHIW